MGSKQPRESVPDAIKRSLLFGAIQRASVGSSEQRILHNTLWTRLRSIRCTVSTDGTVADRYITVGCLTPGATAFLMQSRNVSAITAGIEVQCFANDGQTVAEDPVNFGIIAWSFGQFWVPPGHAVQLGLLNGQGGDQISDIRYIASVLDARPVRVL